MRRREFITLLGGAAAAWPLAARAQQPAMPVVGFLRSTSANASANLVAALRRGLAEAGYTEGQNLVIEFRWAENQGERLPGLVADLIRDRCAVIIAAGDVEAHAAKAATNSIPIVFATGADPVKVGLVPSLNRPGGNLTGISFYNSADLLSKQLQFLHEVVPNAAAIGLLVNPNTDLVEFAAKRRASGSACPRSANSHRERWQRTRFRRGFRDPRPTAGRRAAHRWQRALHRSTRSTGRAGGTLCIADHLPSARVRRRRLYDEL